MSLIYITIWGVSLLAGISALWALGWSVQRGDLRQGRAQALSIFDADDVLRQDEPTQPLSTRGD